MKLEQLKSRYDIGLVLSAMGLDRFGAEIGVAYGQNAKLMLDKWNCKRFYLIDPYETQPIQQYASNMENVNFEAMLKWSKEHLYCHRDKIDYIRRYSDDAAKIFPDEYFDFVYLDGNHQNPQFKRDLENWLPKVKRGGIFGGHDYCNIDTPTYQCHVKDTVDQWSKQKGFKLHLTTEDQDQSWYIKV